jgi:hypothetical protein
VAAVSIVVADGVVLCILSASICINGISGEANG